MMATLGSLDDRATARQLLAAAVLDLMTIYILTRIILPHLPNDLPVLQRRHYGISLFIVLIPLWWIVTDLLLAGRSPGRLALGLAMATAEGRAAPWHRRVTRLTGKLITLGLPGLRLDRPASYDRFAGVVWLSPLSVRSIRPVGEWSLRFLSGPISGTSIRLERIPGFSPSTPLRIGRDPAWSVLKLRDPQVSGRHCEIDFSNGRCRLRDLHSQNGTFVDGRRIKPGTWVPLDQARQFAVAGQVIAIAY